MNLIAEKWLVIRKVLQKTIKEQLRSQISLNGIQSTHPQHTPINVKRKSQTITPSS